mgnify:FL=1|tara:strand:+ start:8105 stop:8974 length:870 start_codon:yes stop_codon:yes gene_type:complete
MMNVGFVGVGAMGNHMATHVLNSQRFKNVYVYDLSKNAVKDLVKKGAKASRSLKHLGGICDVIIIMVGYDDQVRQVVTDLAKSNPKNGGVLVITATSHPDMILEAAAIAKKGGLKIVDAPVCFGLGGARDGTLASMVGGTVADVKKATPVIKCYSRAVHHLGSLGCGEIGKTVNNMLHWAHSLANQEVLLLAKCYGIDPQKMRETLLQAPGRNGTLEEWDNTRFTWHEKDMDIAMDLAQARDLPLPLFGQVDQLIKFSHWHQIKELLYRKTISFLGRKLKSAPPGKSTN